MVAQVAQAEVSEVVSQAHPAASRPHHGAHQDRIGPVAQGAQAAVLIVEERSAMRGIALAMLLSAPVWMLLALAVYALG